MRLSPTTLLTAALVLASLALPSAGPQQSRGYEAAPAQRAAAEKFLALSGGRSAWRDVRSVRLLAVNHSASVPLPYLFEIWIDFAQPRTMNRLLNHDMDRLRAYLGDTGWGVKEGPNGLTSYGYGAERLPIEHMLWEGAFSRNLWRLAVEDTSLVLRSGQGGRLEFHTRGRGMVSWFVFNAQGYPVRFGFPGDDNGLELGAYGTYGPRRIPITGSTPEGTKFESLYLRASTNPFVPPDTPPADLAAFNPR